MKTKLCTLIAWMRQLTYVSSLANSPKPLKVFPLRSKTFFIVLFLLISFQQSVAQFKVIGYLPTWGGNLSDVQYTKLTHINYAFLIPTSNGGYQAPDDPTRLKNLVSQAHANGVKVIISVGGGGGGDAFRSIVPNATYRTNFVNNMVNFCNQYNLDGTDIDWEFPSDGTEANNFLLLMQQLYTAMHNNGKLCTAAVIAYGGTSFVNGIFNAVDFLNIMAYDENSYDHSTYDLGVKSVNYWVGRGLPASKAVLGVPFYGRDRCCAYKTVNYNTLLSMGADPYADTYNNQVGYNGITTIKKKTAYAMQACSGIMIWSIDTDTKDANSLLSAINQVVVANSNPVPDNLAKGKPATVSSTEASTTTSTLGSNATDGSYSTRWSSLFADPQWVSVDLGANYNVNRVKLTWEAAYATAYQIQISSNGTDWTTLKSVTGNATTTNDQTGLSGTGRYVRIYGTARATAYGYSLYEIEVYGTAIESPYTGTAINLPGKIEAENYDLGGQGLAYNDLDAANQGGAYRTDGIDIQTTTDVGGGYNVGYTADGEWLKYMVNVSTAGNYNFGFRTAGTGTASAIRLEVDGAAVTGSIALPNTGGWQIWANAASPNITLSAGPHIIRLFIVTGGFNLNYVNVTPVSNQAPSVSLTTSGTSFTAPASITLNANATDSDGTISKVEFYNGTTLLGTNTISPYSFVWNNVAAGTYSLTAKATDNSNAATTSNSVSVTVTAPVSETPYGGTAWPIPGTFQAENYDNGGEGIAYHDVEAANQGGAYRTEGIDIEATADNGGGYNVGYTADGEWLKYMVNVTTAGNYNFGIRTAGLGTTSAIRIEIDGAAVTGSIALPNTGGWQTWTTTTVPNITISAGAHVIRLFVVTGGFNLNYVNVTPVPNQAPSVSLATSGTSFTAPASITLNATATDADGTITKVEFYNGTTLLAMSTASPYSFVWNNVAAGTYSLTAKATDNSNASTTSAAVSVTVTSPVNETPYGGTAWPIPGTIQAENYDNGGEGIAYHDMEAANQGGAYRTDGADIEATSDNGGGYNVGYTADGEWLKYMVNVTAAGTYSIGFRTAGTGTASAIRVEIDGAAVTGSIALPNTGGWQIWTTTTIPNITFSAGSHAIRLFVVTGGFNLNSFSVTTPSSMSFLHTSGKNIINNNGNYIIKAINLGNFMVQEGYMNNLGGGYQHIIKQKIADVVGTASRDQFYKDYLTNFITKADIDSLAKWGFNSVRLPMHYNLFTPLGQPDTYLESGFVLVDNIISWCKANNMYVILDLHAAPGGQSSGDISDYIAGQPSLWESDANRAQTVKLWAKFAQRYANETAVGGYDLINETNWTLANNNALLMQIMKDITAAIRQVDNNHIVFIEGNSYANDYNGLTPKWDNNMVYSFHKYWNDNSQGSLNFIFAIRDGQNVPIWMGEFGENSNNWIADAVSLMNANNIGWAIWPYKKMSSVSSVGSYKQPSNWSALANYINGGTKPSAAVGQAILNEWLEDIKAQNCTVNRGYLNALFKQPGNNNTIPFATVSLPGKVLTANYDEGKNGYAYNDAAFQNTQYGSTVGSSTSWNMGWYYRNDGVDLQYSTAENGPTVGYTDNNEWMNYTVYVSTSGTYTVKVRAAGNGGTLSLSSDGTTLISNATIAATGGWDAWQTMTLGTMNLTAGIHTLRATINTAGYNLSYLDFSTTATATQTTSSNSTGTTTNSCSGVMQYSENAGYIAGSIVQNAGSRYQCKPYPSSGWCNGAAWAYAPGTGSYWSDAWTLLGSCTSASRTATVDNALISNSPNPFNSSTNLQVVVTESGDVSVKIYDMTGQVVGTVVEDYLTAGVYNFVVDASNLKANVYMVKYNSASGTVIQKIIKTE